MLILSTVPSNILNLLSIGPDPTINDLVTAVLQHLQTNTSTDYKYPESEAQTLRVTDEMTFKDYISKYNVLLAHITASKYPNITEETTTIETAYVTTLTSSILGGNFSPSNSLLSETSCTTTTMLNHTK